jgi:hypothetical protein
MAEEIPGGDDNSSEESWNQKQYGNIMRGRATERQADSEWKVVRLTTPESLRLFCNFS